jgi:peptide/nickel transport system substrate-binding protein
MKKQVSLWLLAFAVVGLLYGCGGGESSTTNENNTSDTSNTSDTTTDETNQTSNSSENQAPLANFVAQALGDSLDVSLDATTSTDTDGSIAKYEWRFPDGSTAEGQKVEHTFATAGAHDVTLTVTDNNDSANTSTLTVTVVDSSASNRDEHLRLSEGTVLRIPITSEPRYFLPNATEGTWESTISALIFEYLMQTNENLENLPGIANVEWNPDNLTYTFYMKPGVEFHDGVELTCTDVMFSYKAWTHPDYPGPRFGNFENIVGAQARRDGESTEWPIEGLNCVDDHTFTVRMDSIQRTFVPYAVASSGIMPAHVYEPYLDENGYDKMQGAELDMNKFVGTGPFKFAEWEPGQYIRLVRNENYWQTRDVGIESQFPLAGIEEMYFIFVRDPATQLAKLLADEVDVLDTRSEVNNYFELTETAGYNTHTYSQLVYDYWHWNFRNPLFQDVNVRRAMCSALDRQRMVDVVLKGLGELSNGPSHPLRWDWDESLREIHPTFNISETIQLMEAAGWAIDKNEDGSLVEGAVWSKGDQMMEFEIATNQGNDRRGSFMVLMQEQLAAAGFKASTRVLDTNAFYNDYLDGQHEFETAIAGWRMGTDPDGTSVWHTKSIDTAFNWTGYSNPEIDALIEEGVQFVDLDKARPIYQEMNKKLVEDMGYCWLSFQMGTFGSKSGVANMEPWSPLGPYSNILNWYWDGKGLPVSVTSPAD